MASPRNEVDIGKVDLGGIAAGLDPIEAIREVDGPLLTRQCAGAGTMSVTAPHAAIAWGLP